MFLIIRVIPCCVMLKKQFLQLFRRGCASVPPETCTQLILMRKSYLVYLSVPQPLLHVLWIYFALLYLEVKKTGGDPLDICLGGKEFRGSVPEVNEDVPDDEDDLVSEERQRVDDWYPGADVTVSILHQIPSFQRKLNPAAQVF